MLAMISSLSGIILLGLALVLPAASLQSSSWTPEDAKKLAEISDQFHRSAYQSPAEQGLSPEEFAARQEKMKAAQRALSKKLEAAIDSPRQWQALLKWGGCVLVALGAISYVASRSRG